MRLFKKLRRKLDYLERDQIVQIHQAYLVALEAHRGQKRQTGEPYVTHPVAVACILAEMNLDHQTIMAALLHDVLEDTAIDKAEMIEKFGEVVTNLVDGVSKLSKIMFGTFVEAQAENFRKMVLAMARDIRVILVKLADRLHNMRTLESLSVKKRRRIAQETLDIYAPIGKRLGMRRISVELEELGFMWRYPRRYAILKDAVRQARGNRKKVLTLIQRTLIDGLAKAGMPACHVIGREKHLYSIYRKMRVKHIPFNDIMDVYAFRIVVDDSDACYRALGIAHSLFKPVPERFKDYIAIPKANGYQSLHTTLFGPYGLPIEVQIRTTGMNRLANSGIAAHWLYKSKEGKLTDFHVRAQQWIRHLLELQQRSGNSLEFIESVKTDLFPDEVYVFTPKGDILELPGDATAVDFAYAVHTDVGNSCMAVKVNRQMASLSTVLTSGQTVEVICSARARPSPAWLDFVITSKARSAIRHFLKNRRRAESVELGRQLLEKMLRGYQLSLKKVSQAALDYMIKEAGLKSAEHLFEEVGLGNRVALLTARRLAEISQKESDVGALPEVVETKPMAIKGVEGMLLEFASCCKPIPGDPISGILTTGRGLVVHMDRCEKIEKMRQHETCIPLCWADDMKDSFVADVEFEVVNKRGVLAVLALAVSDAEGNIEDINLIDKDGKTFFVSFKLRVKDRQHLARIMRAMREVSQVLRVERQ